MLDELSQVEAFASDIEQLRLQAEQKLWRQFQLNLEKLLTSESFAIWKAANISTPLLQNFFNAHYGALVGVVNPIDYCRVCLMVFDEVALTSSIEKALDFLLVLEAKLEDKEAKLLIASNRVAVGFKNGIDVPGSVARLREIEVEIENLGEETHTPTHAAFHYALVCKAKILEESENLYNETFRFLGYRSLADIDHVEQSILLVDAAMAILLADELISSGELLCHEIFGLFETLEHFYWLKDLVLFFTRGEIETFSALVENIATHRTEGNEQYIDAIMENKDHILEKVKVMALVELAFRKKKGESITAQEISSFCRIGLLQYEFLAMKAFDAGLLKGKINQMKGLVHVDWIKPRVLSKDQIEGALKKIEEWRTKVNLAIDLIEENTSELLLKT